MTSKYTPEVPDKNRNFHENLMYDTFVKFRQGNLVRVEKKYKDADMVMSKVNSVIVITISFDKDSI